MRFHVVSLPHTQTTKEEFSWCAYTQKVRKFCDMMTGLGHTVYLYASEENDANVHELIPCIRRAQQQEHFRNRIPDFDARHPQWALFNTLAIASIAQRIRDRDFICLIGGLTQKPIADAFPGHMSVEFGIGYEGCFAKFRVFESYAWMHAVYGTQMGASRADGRWFDTVIPNYFDLSEFPFSPKHDGYLLYMGRLIERKGVGIALETAKRSGIPLVVAGAGDYPLPPGTDYRGNVGSADRAKLMGGALAILVPTHYLEPFGGVAVEAMLCGTPAITSDWGAFPETVSRGVSGFRCRDLPEFEFAARNVHHIPRPAVREHAMHYSMSHIAYQYDNYFSRLETVWDNGFVRDGASVPWAGYRRDIDRD